MRIFALNRVVHSRRLIECQIDAFLLAAKGRTDGPGAQVSA